jgi:hypothetical protein
MCEKESAMFISNLLSCSNSPFSANQSANAKELDGFQEIMENILSEKNCDATESGEGELIDISSLKAPGFFIEPYALTEQGFDVSSFGDGAWYKDMNLLG